VCKLGASKPVSHISRTITNLSGSSGCFISENRIKNIAQDIVSHFEQRQAVFEGKGMIVSMSRRIAADLYAQIIKIKPDWHSDDLEGHQSLSATYLAQSPI
jgi:type I site-specific restriction-modification system R (restriction) subunit